MLLHRHINSSGFKEKVKKGRRSASQKVKTVTEIVVLSKLLKYSQVACISPYNVRPMTEVGTGSESLSSQDLDFITCFIYKGSAVNSCL